MDKLGWNGVKERNLKPVLWTFWCSGRPKSLSVREKKNIVRIVAQTPKISAPEVVKTITSAIGKVVYQQI